MQRKKISLGDLKASSVKASLMGFHPFHFPKTNTSYYSDKEVVNTPTEGPIFYIGIVTGIDNYYSLSAIQDLKDLLKVAKNNSLALEKAYSMDMRKEKVIANLMRKGRDNPKEYQQGVNLHIIACHQDVNVAPSKKKLKEMMDDELRKLELHGEEVEETDLPEIESQLIKKFALDQIRERLESVVAKALDDKDSLENNNRP